jgi:hypothetical protein
MDDQDLAAPSAAADEAITSPAVAEATEDQTTEGQVQDQPAEGDESPEEKSKSQARRERREASARRAQEERDAAEQRAREAEARLNRIRNAASGVAEPKEADFADVIEYAAARGAYAQARAAARYQEQEAQAELTESQKAVAAAEQARKEQLLRSYEDQLPDAKTRYADFEKVVSSAQITQDVALMVMESDRGPDVAYFLGANPDVARRLSQLPAVQAARELGRIEAGLVTRMPKMQSAAPDPISPVRASARASVDPAKMSAQEYQAWRAAGGKF